ncbi:alpha-L-fucosidase 1 [Tasmannia lanceolata]|uniref:alpha-L-fucosidase 1 n=1 Tax=Tasmannia lanceolata TaxID=3420 RepID=UPI0040644738
MLILHQPRFIFFLKELSLHNNKEERSGNKKKKKTMNHQQQAVQRIRKSSSNNSSTKPIISHNTTTLLLLLFFSLSTPISSSLSNPQTPPPLPILPLPTSLQLSWQLSEMSLFLHFGTNTFTDSEWGTGHADPSVFNPSSTLDPAQWVQVAKNSGFSSVILTAKHHDGFCLWPSVYTNYSVQSSPWKGGKGDVVAELAVAARAAGIELGLYLSPWDRHEAVFGKTIGYNEFYMGQLTELLTGYGEIKHIWLDGAKGEGEKNMDYLFETWFGLIRQLQPSATIFSDAGPDTRWVGDEDGAAGFTCWSLFNRSSVTIGGDNDYQYTRGGDPNGCDWVPPECDVSIRPGWFWHSSEKPKSAKTLLDLYYKSVGRNCLLLLNVPPNSSGLISDEDIQVLQDFAELRHIIFSDNLAENAIVNASSTRGDISDPRFSPVNVLREGIYTYWAPQEGQSSCAIYLDLGQLVSFNVLQVQEPIQMGQRITEFHLDVLNKGQWTTVINGTTVGYKRLVRFTMVKSQWLRFIVDKSRGDPLISYLGIYMDPFSIAQDSYDLGSLPYFDHISSVIKFFSRKLTIIASKALI